MIKFSIVICSRGRVNLLEQNITTLKLLASDPDAVQILIGADDDDAPTVAKVKELQDQFINVELSVHPQFKNLHKFNNLLASQSAGDYIWVMNDDSFLEVADWDKIISDQIEAHLARHPDRVGYFSVSSNSADKIGNYAEFPLVTREAYKSLGFVEFEALNAWGCDTMMHRIYSSVDRVFSIQIDRPIRHILHEKGSEDNDNRKTMTEAFKAQFGQDWGQAVRNMQEFVRTTDITPYSAKLMEKICA